MILAIDVNYYECKAKVVGILYESWKDERPEQIVSTILENTTNYESGNFYKRELPCIVKLLKKIELSKIECIVVDGFVYLDDNNKLGLGGYLYKYLNNNIPVIGVAKNSFHENIKNVRLIYRGTSKKPLYISSVGVNLDKASNLVLNMSGNYRFPALLRFLDQETKNNC